MQAEFTNSPGKATTVSIELQKAYYQDLYRPLTPADHRLDQAAGRALDRLNSLKAKSRKWLRRASQVGGALGVLAGWRLSLLLTSFLTEMANHQDVLQF